MTLPVHLRLLEALAAHGDLPVQRWRGAGGAWRGRTAAALREDALRLAAGLRALGVAPGDRVGLLADGGPLFAEANLAILAAGAADVPRGSDSTPAEIATILEHGGVRVCLCAGEAALRRVLEAPGARERLTALVRLDDGGPPAPGVLAAAEVRARGGGPLAEGQVARSAPGDLAALVYTSGSTGHPRGVTLLHRNFDHQLRVLPEVLEIRRGDVFLSLLPPWHCYERVVEAVALLVGAETVFTDRRRLGAHLVSVRPTWMAGVPRVWEALHHAARLAGTPLAAALGGNLRCGISGGGLLPGALDEAYAAAGVRLLVGYGLTEAAPVVSVRRPEANLLGSIGRPIPETEVEVLDRETRRPLPPGKVGVLRVRGPQVMAGYWRDPEATAAVLSPDGWLDTGDLVSRTAEGDLHFRGRAKETIVLRGGENVEPEPLEERLASSPFIEQALVVGQDERTLGALLVPRREASEEEVRRLRGSPGPVSPGEMEGLLHGECARLLTAAAGFHPWERVVRVRVLAEPFAVENGLLTGTLKVRRRAVMERYAGLVREMTEGA